VCKKLFREKREFNGCEVLQLGTNHLSGKVIWKQGRHLEIEQDKVNGSFIHTFFCMQQTRAA